MADERAGPREQGQLRTLLETLKRITALTPPDALQDAIADAAARLLGFETGGFRLVEGDELVLAGQWGDAVMLRPRIRIGESLAGRIAQTGQPLIVEDLQNDERVDPAHREADRYFGYQTFLGLPLQIGGRVVGVLALRSRTRRRLRDDEVALAQAFADHAAIALENARLYEAAQQQRRQAEVLTGIARDVSAALDRDTVLQRVVEHARRLCRADLVALALFTPGRAEATVVAKTGHRSEVYDHVSFRPGVGLGGEALASRKVVTSADRLNDARWPPDEPAHAEDIRATAAVPIIAGDDLLGVLWIHRRTADPFAHSDVVTIEALARHAAVTIQNASLYAAAEARALEVQALRRIGLTLARSFELPRVLQHIVEAAREGTSADAAFCALADPVSREVQTVASSGARTAVFAGYRFERGKGVGGWFLDRKSPFRTADYLADTRFVHAFDDAIRAEGVVAALGVPILEQNEVSGALWVVNRTGRPFTDRDEGFLTGLGDHAVVAIVNARVHAERERALAELRTSQDRLVQTERLRALGEMASGVAHDFNNLLAVILGRVQLLLLRAEDAELRRGLTVIERAAADAAHTVRRIQEFTRTRKIRVFERVDLRQVVREAVELTRGRWKDEAQVRGVTYTVTTDLDEVPAVGAEPAELREVVTNLVLNAIDAMPEGGGIHLAVRSADGFVVTTVRDTGPGMPPEVSERVFEPFFTTKGPRSTGLGLSVAYGIIQRHGGRIEVASAERQGSTFTITLPTLGAAELPVRPSRTGHGRESVGARARILVVEDEAPVRDVLVDLLRTAGHAVHPAEDGPGGLRLVEQVGPVDVALVDLGLPGMSGWEVAERLRILDPALPVVLITGWGDQLDPAAIERTGVREVIAKPFQGEQVLRVVTDLVRSRVTAR
jgi:signal transduction histidine kinase/CheY-like chemotaxis protein/putative methionine-R-sulfoxide reductase with GAF domain